MWCSARTGNFRSPRLRLSPGLAQAGGLITSARGRQSPSRTSKDAPEGERGYLRVGLLVCIALGDINPSRQNAGSASPLAGLVFYDWMKVKVILFAHRDPSCHQGS